MNNFKEIKERLNKQDNRATAHPIFVVYDYEKVPSCSDYTDDWEYCYDEGTIGTTKEDMIECLEDWDLEFPNEKELKNMSADELMEWTNENQGEEAIRKFYYIKKKIFINVFFTEESADIFIAQNNYHYTKEVHTYVNCLWRNPEMQFIREMIMSGKLDGIFPDKKGGSEKD